MICSAYSSTLKTEAESSSETSENFQTTRHHTLQDSILKFNQVYNLIFHVTWRIMTSVVDTGS
jgi:hypothetical protein